jgi:N-acyl homoserine lactone hydrolase
VYAHLIEHSTGPILIDTGVGIGNPLIDRLYSPVHHDLDRALHRHRVAVDEVTTVITSHLHFDHCGQNHRFVRSRIFVQRSEIEAARAPHYTIEERAFPPQVELTAIDGDFHVAPGVQIIATPGHAHEATNQC